MSSHACNRCDFFQDSVAPFMCEMGKTTSRKKRCNLFEEEQAREPIEEQPSQVKLDWKDLVAVIKKVRGCISETMYQEIRENMNRNRFVRRNTTVTPLFPRHMAQIHDEVVHEMTDTLAEEPNYAGLEARIATIATEPVSEMTREQVVTRINRVLADITHREIQRPTEVSIDTGT